MKMLSFSSCSLLSSSSSSFVVVTVENIGLVGRFVQKVQASIHTGWMLTVTVIVERKDRFLMYVVGS